jgi:hypothetical protein
MFAIPHKTTFDQIFFSSSLHQQFNDRGTAFLSDETTAAITKYVMAMGRNRKTANDR